MQFKPVGSKMLILPQATENFKTNTGIEIIQAELDEGIVVEVSDEYEKVYPVGQRVSYSRGAGYNKIYNGKNCLIIDCRSVNTGGDVWAKIIEDQKELQ